MKLPMLSRQMRVVLTGITIFTVLAPGIVYTVAPTILWLEGLAGDAVSAAGGWFLHLTAALLAMVGMLAYLSVWAWPLAVILLFARSVRIIKRRFPRPGRKTAHAGAADQSAVPQGPRGRNPR